MDRPSKVSCRGATDRLLSDTEAPCPKFKSTRVDARHRNYDARIFALHVVEPTPCFVGPDDCNFGLIVEAMEAHGRKIVTRVERAGQPRASCRSRMIMLPIAGWTMGQCDRLFRRSVGCRSDYSRRKEKGFLTAPRAGRQPGCAARSRLWWRCTLVRVGPAPDVHTLWLRAHRYTGPSRFAARRLYTKVRRNLDQKLTGEWITPEAAASGHTKLSPCFSTATLTISAHLPHIGR